MAEGDSSRSTTFAILICYDLRTHERRVRRVAKDRQLTIGFGADCDLRLTRPEQEPEQCSAPAFFCYGWPSTSPHRDRIRASARQGSLVVISDALTKDDDFRRDDLPPFLALTPGSHFVITCRPEDDTRACSVGKYAIEYLAPEDSVPVPEPPAEEARNFQDLPFECLLHIFSFLPPDFVANTLAMVSETINEVIFENKVPFRSLKLDLNDLCECTARVWLSVINGASMESFEMKGFVRTPGAASMVVMFLNAIGVSLKRLKFSVNYDGDQPEIRTALQKLVQRNKGSLLALALMNVDVDDPPEFSVLRRLDIRLDESKPRHVDVAHRIILKAPKLTSFFLSGSAGSKFWGGVNFHELAGLTRAGFTYQKSIPFTALRELETLSLFGVSGQGFENVGKSIKSLRKLKHLFLEVDMRSNMEPFGIGIPDFLKKLPADLVSFVISWPRFTDSFCQTLAERCADLETFVVLAPGATDVGVKHLLEGCVKLKRLSISSGRFWTTPGVPRYDEVLVPRELQRDPTTCAEELRALFGLYVKSIALKNALSAVG